MQRAERTVRAEAEPAAGVGVHYVRGVLELAHGRDADALAAFQAAERLAGPLAAPNLLLTAMRAFLVQTLVRLGETERAEQAIAGLGEQERERGELRMALAVLRLTQDDPRAARAALAAAAWSAAGATPSRHQWSRHDGNSPATVVRPSPGGPGRVILQAGRRPPLSGRGQAPKSRPCPDAVCGPSGQPGRRRYQHERHST